MPLQIDICNIRCNQFLPLTLPSAARGDGQRRDGFVFETIAEAGRERVEKINPSLR